MEKNEAKDLLISLRRDAADLRNNSTVSYAEVQKLVSRLIAAAEEIFGSDAIEVSNARIAVLRPEQLAQMKVPLRAITHQKDSVTHILRPPEMSPHEYYAKKISQVDEAIVAMLHSFSD